jgi:FMN phosphatase YigB (HAD superfamily)
VGDNPDSEIEAGNRLGITTVQILRLGVPHGNNATQYIHDLAELKGLLMQRQD